MHCIIHRQLLFLSVLLWWKRHEIFPEISFLRALIPFKRDRPSHLPRAPPPNTITLEVRISTFEFWKEHTHSDYSTNYKIYTCFMIFIHIESWQYSKNKGNVKIENGFTSFSFHFFFTMFVHISYFLIQLLVLHISVFCFLHIKYFHIIPIITCIIH